MIHPTSKEIFYIVFQNPDRFRVWDYFSPPGYRHVFIYKQVYYPKPGLMASKFCLKYEFLVDNVEIDIYWHRPQTVAKVLLENPLTKAILRMTVEKKPTMKFIPRGIMTCVSSVKPFLGVRSPWVVTPYQLYKYLLQNGAEKLGD